MNLIHRASHSAMARTLDKVGTTSNVVNTVDETEIYRKTIQPGALGTDRKIVATLLGLFAAGGGADTLTIRFKYGATTIALHSHVNPGHSTTVEHPVKAVCELFAAGSAAAQICISRADVGPLILVANNPGRASSGGTVTADWSKHETIAEDSTLSKDFVVTVQHSAAAAENFFKRLHVLLEIH